MRSIRFRGWHKHEKRMFEVESLTFPLEGGFVKERDNKHPKNFILTSNLHNSQNVELMQFTGLTDSKGVEIYEGDVVKGISPSIIEYSGIVKMEQGNTYFESKHIKPLLSDMRNLEVLGNIYEDEELLTQKEGK